MPATIHTLQLEPAPAGLERDRLNTLAHSLAAAVDAKGRYTPSHCHGVARNARLIGHALGHHGDTLFRLHIAGLLHDVGKLTIPDSILLKPTTLTTDERATIQRHPIAAHDMLTSLGLHDEARWVLHHHERGDGHGYPTGLAGTSIPLGSRILLVADAYDVMTTTRTYQHARTPGDALAELRTCSDQFDTTIVEALATVLGQAAAA